MNGGENSGLFFLDTNILVYSLAINEPQKQPIAAALIQKALDTRRGFISTQVVQEFLNLATRRANPAFSESEAAEYLKKVLWPLCAYYPSYSFYERALQIRQETGYSLYDALIVAAGVELGCKRLLTEDLQHGRKIQGLTIVNPFIEE
jgi:predicted nucleic acid-binding protein